MKVCLVLLLAVYRISATKITISSIHRDWQDPVQPVINECMDETQVEQHILDDFYKYGRMPDDSCLKCYLGCCGTKLGIINHEGEVDAEKWANMFDFDVHIAHKCAKIKQTDFCEKSYLLVKCVHDELSNRYSQ